MAKFRYIYTDFWSDEKVIENFAPEDKLFMLYLLTNKYTKQIGIYKISLKVIAFETGYSIESISSMIDRFMNHYKLIIYDKDTNEVAIKNWGKYNLNKGGTPIECCIKSEIEEVENKSLLVYIYDGIKNIKLKEIFKEDIDKFKESCGEKSDKQLSTAISTTRNRIRVENENKEENENKKQEGNKNIVKTTSVNLKSLARTSENNSDKVPYKEIIAHYNTICKSLPKVEARSKARDKSIKLLYRKLRSLEKIKDLFSKVEGSDFLTGRDRKWENCSFDWIIRESNYLKILEGNYTSRLWNKKKTNFHNFKGRELDYSSLENKLLGWE